MVSVVKKRAANENSRVIKTKRNILMHLPTCAVCDKKKSTFMKNRELHSFNDISNDQFTMNKVFNKFLLTVDKFMAELH